MFVPYLFFVCGYVGFLILLSLFGLVMLLHRDYFMVPLMVLSNDC